MEIFPGSVLTFILRLVDITFEKIEHIDEREAIFMGLFQLQFHLGDQSGRPC